MELTKEENEGQKNVIKQEDMSPKCEMCNKIFLKKQFLAQHIREVHKKEKNLLTTQVFIYLLLMLFLL